MKVPVGRARHCPPYRTAFQVLTLAIAGYGHIGRRTALKAKAMGMTVLAYNRSDKVNRCRKTASFP